MNKAFTFVELLIVVCIVALLSAIAVPNFWEAETRADVANVADSQNRMAMALSMYHIDYSRYPNHFPFTAGVGYVAAPGVNKNYNQLAVEAQGGSWPSIYFNVPSFAVVSTTSHAIGLTSPIAYLKSYALDVFSFYESTTFKGT